jgi:hypothetical protein
VLSGGARQPPSIELGIEPHSRAARIEDCVGDGGWQRHAASHLRAGHTYELSGGVTSTEHRASRIRPADTLPNRARAARLWC